MHKNTLRIALSISLAIIFLGPHPIALGKTPKRKPSTEKKQRELVLTTAKHVVKLSQSLTSYLDLVVRSGQTEEALIASYPLKEMKTFELLAKDLALDKACCTSTRLSEATKDLLVMSSTLLILTAQKIISGISGERKGRLCAAPACPDYIQNRC